jgi:hypothetical protein
LPGGRGPGNVAGIMRRALVAAAIFAVVLLIALQALSASGPLDDREVGWAVLFAAVGALLVLRRRRGRRRRRR